MSVTIAPVKRLCRSLHVISALVLAALLVLAGDRAHASPSFAARGPHAGALKASPLLLPVRSGACAESCPDCTDCPTEIDIVPYPRHEDPIGHAIKRLPPPPPSEACETDRYAEKARQSPDTMGTCGIRCWYWRLRHGYCGPGCEYYQYRMRLRDDRGPNHPRYACRS